MMTRLALLISLALLLSVPARAQDVMAEMQSILQEGQALQAEFPRFNEQVRLAGRLEDVATVYRLAGRLSGDFDKRITALLDRVDRVRDQLRAMGALDPATDAMMGKLRQQFEQDRTFAEVIEVGNLTNTGMYTEAVARGEELLPRLAGNPDFETAVRIFVLQAGRGAGRPDVVDRQLGLLKPTEVQDRFWVESVRFERELQENPGLPVSGFLARRDEVWPLLAKIPVESLDRYVARGARIWILANDRLALRTGPDSPDGQTLARLAAGDVATLQRLANQSWSRPLLKPDGSGPNPQWDSILYFAVLDLHLDLAARARETGRSEEARRHLQEVEAALPLMEASVPDLEALALKVFPDPGLRPDVRRGYFSRIPARFHEEQGRTLLDAGEAAAGALELGQALELYRRAGAEALRLRLLPTVALLKKDVRTADEAVAAAEKAGDRPALVSATLARGRLLAAAGQVAPAREALLKGTKLLEELLVELGTETPEIRRLQEEARPAYEALASLQMEGGKQDEAFAALARMQQAASYGAAQPRVGAAQPPAVRRALEKVDDARARLRGLQDEEAALASMPDGPEVRQAKKRASELVASSRSEFYSLLGDLYRTDPRYETLAVRPVVFGQIQKTLPADTAVLQYFPSEKDLYLFALSRDSVAVRKVPGASRELQDLTRRFRTRMGQIVAGLSRGEPAPAWPDPALQETLYALHGLLVEPVEKDVEKHAVLAVVPTGDLLYLPFAALARPGAGGAPEFLAERKQVVTLARSSDLLNLAGSPPRSAGEVVAFGNPDGTLAAAEKEVQAIQVLFPSAVVFLGARATKEALEQVQGKVGYLHMATHGVLDRRDPQGNHLVVAGGADGKLTVDEIAALDLGPSARLVTLSACQTALNDREPRSELLQSVADAFGFAGSPTVVASLWTVEDESTALLMGEFYKRLKAGEARSQALQGAEKALLGKADYRHPYYWAPFILLGDWR